MYNNTNHHYDLTLHIALPILSGIVILTACVYACTCKESQENIEVKKLFDDSKMITE